nr:hypothetical protein [Protofrankia symbiont of Coriaria ruscifolia]
MRLHPFGTHPDCDGPTLDLITDWYVWVFFFDDHFLEHFKYSRDLSGAKAYLDRLELFMTAEGETSPEPTNPAEAGLKDLWRRTAGPMALPARRQFRKAVEDMTSSWLWELDNQAQHRIPDPVDYIEMRRKTFGSDMTMSLARLAHADVVPPEIYQNRTLRELDAAAQDYAAFTNDLFSYQKEIEFEGETHNLVLVVENFLNVDRLQARDIVADLMTARMRQFEHIIANDLPALFDEFDLDEPVRDILTRHADDLKEWMSGILEWHRRCVRYTESELRRSRTPDAPADFSFLPTGLGTSAVRVTALVGSGGLR